jgi:1-acyl-sn-glycerol-3-phosphate acyltransferase
MSKMVELFDSLISTSPEVLKKIEQYDLEGRYNEHVDPVNYDACEVVDKNFKYINKPIKTRIKYFFMRNFICKPFEKRELKRMGYSVKGRENLKGIKSAVVTSNHVLKLDCTLNRAALKGHKLYITAADFNNYKGFLGDVMRSCNMMPMSEDRASMMNFIRSVNTLLSKNNYVLFYPERSEWWCFKKPRPLLEGAFHFAAKNNRPIIPNFITFKENGRVDKNGIKLFDMCVNVLKPIYPKSELSVKENEKYLMEENFREWKECYELTYGIELKLNEVAKNQSREKVSARIEND